MKTISYVWYRYLSICLLLLWLVFPKAFITSYKEFHNEFSMCIDKTHYLQTNVIKIISFIWNIERNRKEKKFLWLWLVMSRGYKSALSKLCCFPGCCSWLHITPLTKDFGISVLPTWLTIFRQFLQATNMQKNKQNKDLQRTKSLERLWKRSGRVNTSVHNSLWIQLDIESLGNLIACII